MSSRLALTIGLVLLLATVAACGGNDSDDAFEGGVTSSFAGESPSDADFEADMDAVAEMDAEYNDSDEGPAAQISSDGFDRKVIRSAEIQLEVSDVRASVRHARDLAEDYGGHVDSSSARALSDREEVADLTLEVPSNQFDPVLDALRDGPYVVEIEHETTSSRDVTEEYVDLQARLANLESTESRFVALLEDAHTINETLEVENQISRVRGEIEQIQGRLNYLEQRTDYSRIYVAFYPEKEDSIHIAGQHFTPVETARESWDASMQFMGAIGNALIAVAVFFWWGWPLLAIAVLMLVRYRRRNQEPVSPVGA